MISYVHEYFHIYLFPYIRNKAKHKYMQCNYDPQFNRTVRNLELSTIKLQYLLTFLWVKQTLCSDFMKKTLI